jgi:uncharacterized membrane protein YphA (DoxX/SURF4 family)
LLRAAVGIIAIVQGGVYLADRDSSTLEVLAVGLLVAVSGSSLLLGFLTPVSSGLVALATVAIALAWFPAPNLNLFSSPLPAVLVVIIAAAVAFLGPGAISVDCRLFGRREIIIPHIPRTPRV